MALNSNEVRTDFTADTSKLHNSTKQARDEFGRFQKGAESARGGLLGFGNAAHYASTLVSALAVGAVGLFIRNSAAAASRAQETENLFKVSFGSMSEAAQEWAASTQQAVGVNDTTLKGMAGTLFNMTTSMGLTREGAFALSTGFSQLALDMASFFNIGFEDALTKLRAGLAGEAEPLKQLGVLVNENTIKATAFAQAIKAQGREMTEAEKVQARAIVITQGLGNAQNDLIRTQDSWANQTRIVGEAWTNLQETVGQFLTNSAVLGSVIGFITDSINNLSASIQANKGDWETMVNGGVFFFISAAENTVRTIAFMIEGIGALTSGLGTLLSGLAAVSQFMLENTPIWKLLPDSMRESAEQSVAAVREMGSALEQAGQGVFEVGGTVRDTAGDISTALDRMVLGAGKAKEETDAAGATTKTYADLLAALSGNITTTTGALALNEKQLKAQAKAAKETEKILADLSKEMLNVATSTQIGAVFTEDYLGKTVGLVGWLEEMPPVLGDIAEGIAAAYGPDGQLMVGGLTDKVTQSRSAMDTMNDVLSEARGLMTLFGVEADSTFGKIINWVSKAFDAFNSLTGIISKVVGLFSSGGGGGGGGGGGILGTVLSAVGGGGGGTGGILGGLLGGGGAAAGTAGALGIGGSVAGSFAGAGLTATVGGAALTGTAGTAAAAGGAAAGGIGLTALAATGYGAIAVAAIIAIRAALKKASAETTAEFLGIDFDVLSEGLQDTLQEQGKAMGDFAAALQLNIGKVFAEGGIQGGVDAFAEKVADTYSFLERGQLNATQAQQTLNETVAQLLPQVGQMGTEGVLQLERLLAAAQQTGVGFDGMSELAKAYVERANELGVSVNNVVLEALGLTDALALLGGSVPEGGGAPADALGNIAGEAAAASQEVADLIRKLQEATAASKAGGVELPGGFDPDVTAQAGFFSPELPQDTLIQAHRGEMVSIVPKGHGGGGGASAPMTINVTVDAKGSFGLDSRDIADAITKMIEQNLAGAQSRLQRALGVEG